MAYEVKSPTPLPHSLSLDSRQKLKLTGITDVESFDENEVCLNTSLGAMTVEGDNLHMEKLTLDSGEVFITGNISCLRYENPPALRRSFFSRFTS